MADKKQKILSSKKVFDKAKFFYVNELEIEFPNGIRAIHHVVERKPVVYIFPIINAYEIYFVKEYSYVTKETVLKVPAGFIEEEENALQAAKRELREETGITATQWEMFSQLDLAKTSLHAKAYLFVAKGLEFQLASPEETEDIEILKIPLREAVQKVLNGEIRQAAVVAGILMIAKLKDLKRV